MCKRIIPFTFSLLFVVAAIAQDFARVKFASPHGSVASSRATCSDNTLGNLTGFGLIVGVDGGSGMSNSVPSANDVTYLCFGDQFSVLYDDTNVALDGDPNMDTPGGIAYIAYNRDPNEAPIVADGPDIATILNDNASLLGNPTNVQNVFFAVDLLLNGNETFENKVFNNGQTLQERFSPNGEPLQVWFSPISVDAYDVSSEEVIYEGSPAGGCVTVNLDETFSVVYLNPIEFVNNANNIEIVYPFGSDKSRARFQVNGGLPEFDQAENYTITVTNVSDPTVTGQVLNNSIGAGDFVEISLPEEGTYTISISDSKNCSTERTLVTEPFEDFTKNADFIINAPLGATINQEFCADLVVENFDSLVGVELYVCWDSDILEFSQVTNLTDLGGDWQFGENLASSGALIGSLLSVAPFGETYPDGTVIASFCFVPKQIGEPIIEFCKMDPRANAGNNQSIPGSYLTADSDGGNTEILFSTDPGTDSDPIIITDPNALTVILNEVKDVCEGRNNGEFSIQVLGGVPPYTAIITNTATGAQDVQDMITDQNPLVVFSGLRQGDYNYEVFDGTTMPNPKFSGTLGPLSINETVLRINPVEISIPTCRDDTNGEFGVIVRNNANLVDDLSDYSFIWTDNVTGDTISRDETAINLIAGSIYDVMVTNNNGCTAPPTVANVSNPTALRVGNITRNLASCSGAEDGSIEIGNASGGIGNLSYSWEHDPNLTQNIANNIAPGNYTFTITDDNDCELTESFQLDGEFVFSVAIDTVRGVTCFGFDDGAIEINRTIDEGVINGMFNFTWSDNVTDIDGVPSFTSIASNLAPGDYSVTITNDDLPSVCQATQTFEIGEPDSLMVESVTITNVTSCSLTNPDGGAAATFTGGIFTTDYQYTWTDTMGMTIGATNEVTNQPSGMITLTVEDDNGCMTTIDTVIGTPPPPNIDFFDPVNLNCATDVGVLQVVAVPGRAGVLPLTFEWEHDPMLATETAINLSPGTYRVTVVDADGCASLDSSFVTAPEIIRTDTVRFTEPCFGLDAGEINITLTGGVSNNYDIEWTALGETGVLGTNAILNNVPSGNFALSVRDENNCPFDTMITLNSLPRILVNFDPASITEVACFDTPMNACNGAAVAMAEYEGTGGGAFTFTWNATGEMSGTTTNMFPSDSLCAGMQAITVSDGECEVIDSVNIPSPDRIELDEMASIISPARCFGEDNGAASISAIGGVGNYTYEWPGGSMETMRNDLVADTYEITITDGNDCVATQNVEIMQPDMPLTASIDPDNTNGVICAGDADGLITVLVEGGNGGYTYTWTNNVSSINSAAGLPPANYIIVVTDSKGCETNTDYLVQEPAPITAQIDFDPIQCFGFQTGIRIIAPTGGNGNDYSFSVDNSPARPSDEAITDFGGEKLISLFDATGCRVDTMVTIPQPRELLVGFAENLVEVDLGGAIPIQLLIDGDAPVAEIFWTQDGGEVNDSVFTCLGGLLCDAPTVNPLNNTLFTAFVTDANGCMSEASIQVDVDKNRNVYIPNVFAPNNAGFDTNDRFGVFTGSGVSKINYAKVFNRWGTMVADIPETRVQGVGELVEVWDGQLKGEKANQGTYIYIIEIEFIDGQKLLYRGDVALLR